MRILSIMLFLIFISKDAFAYSCNSSNVINGLISNNISFASQNTSIIINYFETHGRTEGCIPNGVYYLNNQITIRLNHNRQLFRLILSDQAVLKATTSHPKRLFEVRGIQDSNNSHKGRVEVMGGTFDVTNLAKSSVQNRGTVIEVFHTADVNIHHTKMNALYQGSQRGGDSGIAVVNSNRTFIENNHFTGFSDSAIYVGGFSYPYDPIDPANNQYRSRAHIRNNQFYNNSIGVSVKRRLPYVEIRDNSFKESAIDILEGETSDNHPGSSMYIIGNKTENHTNHFVHLAFSRGTTIRDNLIFIRPNHLSQSHKKVKVPVIRIFGGDNTHNNQSSNQIWIHGNKIWDWRNHQLSEQAIFVWQRPFTNCANGNRYRENYSSLTRLTSNRIMTSNAQNQKLIHMDQPLSESSEVISRTCN